MSKPRWWMAMSLIAFAFLAGTFAYAQNKEREAEAARRLQARKAVLSAQEARRIEIANDLEFAPRDAVKDFKLPFLCLIPPPTPAADPRPLIPGC